MQQSWRQLMKQSLNIANCRQGHFDIKCRKCNRLGKVNFVNGGYLLHLALQFFAMQRNATHGGCGQSGDIVTFHPTPESCPVDAELIGDQGTVAAMFFKDAQQSFFVGPAAGTGRRVDGLAGHV